MNDKIFRDREILSTAQEKGTIATLGAYLRLSGPGWLQSAITLGGGSLGGALYLGVIGGTSMIWLEVVAIIIGVIMLSAISYVVLSTGVRPYQAINEHVNPVLGVSWISATILANMIFILPQFSLCYDVLDKNFGVVSVSTEQVAGVSPAASVVESAQFRSKLVASALLALFAYGIVLLSFRPGWASFIFDLILKVIIGSVVLCFVAVVVYLTRSNEINWGEALAGLIPDVRQWWRLAPEYATRISGLDETLQLFWSQQLLERQREVMLSTTATAVGINMTFLLPYSMLARGWGKTFRGLARWDLITGMAIPFILVTTCIVLSSANAFHAKMDESYASTDPVEFRQSRLFGGSLGVLKARILKLDKNAFDEIAAMPTGTDAEKAAQKAAEVSQIANLAAEFSAEEKILAAALVQPDANQLSKSLEPILGNQAGLVFGLGAMGMGFSTIIILMLINGYALAEIMGRPDNNWIRAIGALAAGMMGFCWFLIWTGASKTYLIILASTFAAILLPIAYFAFFALMNNRKLMGAEKPVGWRMVVWNVLMVIGVLGALAQSVAAVSTKLADPVAGNLVLGGVSVFLLLALVGFSALPKVTQEQS